LAEAAKKDSRKGVAFRQKSLDDLEHSVFAQRLADRLPTKPAGGNYGEFLHQGILRQGEVLGDIQWDYWDIIKRALELGGVDPEAITDPKTTPAQRHALVGKINWQNVTLPALKTKLGPSFKVDGAWKRAFGIAKLNRIKAAVEQGQPVTDQHERQLLGIWRALEVQLGGEGDRPSQILPAGPKSDVGMTRMPMSHADRTRFYKTLTGTNENVEAPLQLSAQSALSYLTQYGVEVVSDEEITDLYLSRILHDLKTGNAFIPSTARGSEADAKRWRDSAARSWGGFLSASMGYDPSSAPGVAQWATGMTTRGHKTRVNPSGRRVPYAYNEPEEFERSGDVPGIKYVIDAPSSEIADERINDLYRSGTPEANAAVERELVKPARDAVNWLRKQGWIDDPSKIDDFVQDVVMAMMGRSGSVPNWRTNTGYSNRCSACAATQRSGNRASNAAVSPGAMAIVVSRRDSPPRYGFLRKQSLLSGLDAPSDTCVDTCPSRGEKNATCPPSSNNQTSERSSL
jgi:hypothetical protein